MRHVPSNQMRMQPHDVLDPAQPVSLPSEAWPTTFDPTDFAGAERRARQAMALVLVGLLSICGAMATAAHAPHLAALARHTLHIG